MATWTNDVTATLKVNKYQASGQYTFPGVSGSNEAGSPDDFLDAVNHLLDIGGQSAILKGISRTIKQGADE